MVEYCKFQR
jgi:hypothetical protein